MKLMFFSPSPFHGRQFHGTRCENVAVPSHSVGRSRGAHAQTGKWAEGHGRSPWGGAAGSAGSWKILLAVLLARTRDPLRAGGVFSLSTRLSPFSGESCSCCGFVMGASGMRTESIVAAQRSTATGQNRMAGTRSTGDPSVQQPLNLPCRPFPFALAPRPFPLAVPCPRPFHWLHLDPTQAGRGTARDFQAQRGSLRRRLPGTPGDTPVDAPRDLPVPPPAPSAGWVGGAAARASTGPTGPGPQSLRVSAALARAGPGSLGNRLGLREALRLEPAGAPPESASSQPRRRRAGHLANEVGAKAWKTLLGWGRRCCDPFDPCPWGGGARAPSADIWAGWSARTLQPKS